MDDEVVYEIMQFTVDNIDKFGEYLPGPGAYLVAKGPKFLSDQLAKDTDLHPAALKFYKDQGWR